VLRLRPSLRLPPFKSPRNRFGSHLMP